jgi:hypothetical protein
MATTYELANRAEAKNAKRYGDVPLGAVIRANERYNRPGLFNGPRGWDYWNRLERPGAYQNPNLWPDKRPTYFWARMAMPAGSSMTLHSRFPRARYMKLAMYRYESGTFVAVGSESLGGWEIAPDPGSGNPFGVGADRTVEDRNFTVRILAEDPPKDPADRPANTMYVGTQETGTQLMYRIYVSDEGWDGAGWGPGWQYRTRTLTADLDLNLKPDQTIHAVGDEFLQYNTAPRRSPARPATAKDVPTMLGAAIEAILAIVLIAPC